MVVVVVVLKKIGGAIVVGGVYRENIGYTGGCVGKYTVMRW